MTGITDVGFLLWGDLNAELMNGIPSLREYLAKETTAWVRRLIAHWLTTNARDTREALTELWDDIHFPKKAIFQRDIGTVYLPDGQEFDIRHVFIERERQTNRSFNYITRDYHPSDAKYVIPLQLLPLPLLSKIITREQQLKPINQWGDDAIKMLEDTLSYYQESPPNFQELAALPGLRLLQSASGHKFFLEIICGTHRQAVNQITETDWLSHCPSYKVPTTMLEALMNNPRFYQFYVTEKLAIFSKLSDKFFRKIRSVSGQAQFKLFMLLKQEQAFVEYLFSEDLAKFQRLLLANLHERAPVAEGGYTSILHYMTEEDWRCKILCAAYVAQPDVTLSSECRQLMHIVELRKQWTPWEQLPLRSGLWRDYVEPRADAESTTGAANKRYGDDPNILMASKRRRQATTAPLAERPEQVTNRQDLSLGTRT